MVRYVTKGGGKWPIIKDRAEYERAVEEGAIVHGKTPYLWKPTQAESDNIRTGAPSRRGWSRNEGYEKPKTVLRSNETGKIYTGEAREGFTVVGVKGEGESLKNAVDVAPPETYIRSKKTGKIYKGEAREGFEVVGTAREGELAPGSLSLHDEMNRLAPQAGPPQTEKGPEREGPGMHEQMMEVIPHGPEKSLHAQMLEMEAHTPEKSLHKQMLDLNPQAGRRLKTKEEKIKEALENKGVPLIEGEKVGLEEKALLGALNFSERVGGKGEGGFFSGLRKSGGDVIGGLATTAFMGEQIGKRATTKEGRADIKKASREVPAEIMSVAAMSGAGALSTLKDRPLYALGYGTGLAATLFLPGKGIGKVGRGVKRVKVGSKSLHEARGGYGAKVTAGEKTRLFMGKDKGLPKNITEAVELSKANKAANTRTVAESVNVERTGKFTGHVQKTVITEKGILSPVIEAKGGFMFYETAPMKARVRVYGKTKKGMAKPGKGREFTEIEQTSQGGEFGRWKTKIESRAGEGVRGLVREEGNITGMDVTGIIAERAPTYKYAMGPVKGGGKPRAILTEQGGMILQSKRPTLSSYLSRPIMITAKEAATFGRSGAIVGGGLVGGMVVGGVKNKTLSRGMETPGTLGITTTIDTAKPKTGTVAKIGTILGGETQTDIVTTEVVTDTGEKEITITDVTTKPKDKRRPGPDIFRPPPPTRRIVGAAGKPEKEKKSKRLGFGVLPRSKADHVEQLITWGNPWQSGGSAKKKKGKKKRSIFGGF